MKTTVTYENSDTKDPRWIKKRDKIVAYADHRCQICGNEAESLDVHHSYYLSGARAWEYPDGSLIAICRPCHFTAVHGRDYRNKETERAVFYSQSAYDQMLEVPIGTSSRRPSSTVARAYWRQAADSLTNQHPTQLPRVHGVQLLMDICRSVGIEASRRDCIKIMLLVQEAIAGHSEPLIKEESRVAGVSSDLYLQQSEEQLRDQLASLRRIESLRRELREARNS